MNSSGLSILAEPWFVVPWYLVGAGGALWVMHDVRTTNTPLKTAMKWAWPIVVVFFSVLGLLLYFATARSPDVSTLSRPEDKQKAHDAYEASMWRRVNGAVIHCVAGDGIGIVSGMVIARATGMSFWQEFWFEYGVGFGVGWLVFQRKSMSMMTQDVGKQLAMAFRAEFFSMLTVMAGMGAVMTFVTPLVVTAQPKPFTFAFWGFAALGLFAGYVLTYPMNWLMVAVGWKHGMGTSAGRRSMSVERRAAAIAGMALLGAAALLLPAWLTELRQGAFLARGPAAFEPVVGANVGSALAEGVHASLDHALEAFDSRNQTRAAVAMDNALRSARVGAHAAPAAFETAFEQIRAARVALQQARRDDAIEHLTAAGSVLQSGPTSVRPTRDAEDYVGAKVINPEGGVIGEVMRASSDRVELALGGWRDAWGFVDFGASVRATVPTLSVAFGPEQRIGPQLVALPTLATSRSASIDGHRTQ